MPRLFSPPFRSVGHTALRATNEAGLVKPVPAYDKARNRHRTTVAWAKGAVRVVLTNPRYTGLVPVATIKRTRHPYQLRGLLYCGICERRMQGSWNNEKPHYRCVYPNEYGLTNHTEHPRSIYLREELLIPALDKWLLRAFCPSDLPHTLQALSDAQEDQHDDEQTVRAAEAKRIIGDCDQRLDRYRAALEAGTDPTLIAGWTAEVNVTRAAAQVQLRAATTDSSRMTPDEINNIVTAFGNLLAVLRTAHPDDKAKIYSGVGLRLTYQPARNTVIAEATPSAIMYEGKCPRTNLNPHYMIRIQEELALAAAR